MSPLMGQIPREVARMAASRDHTRRTARHLLRLPHRTPSSEFRPSATKTPTARPPMGGRHRSQQLAATYTPPLTVHHVPFIQMCRPQATSPRAHEVSYRFTLGNS